MKIITYLLLILLLLLLIVSYVGKPFVNEYLCIGYIGKKGSGKTTKLTQIAINNIKKGKIVYSTEKIVGTRYINYKDIGFYDLEPNSVLLIDEIGLLFPARNYKDFKQEVREFFKLQRHKKITVYWFTQTWIDCDKTIRDLTDRLYICHNFFNMWSTYRQVSKTLTIGTGKNEDGSQNNQGSDFVECFKYVSILQPHAIEFTFIPRYIYFFDSYKHDRKSDIHYVDIAMTAQQSKYLSSTAAYRDFFANLFHRLLTDIKKIPSRFVHTKKKSRSIMR